MFWESVNAGGVLQVPMLLSIWDDGYGISVPNEFQMTKGRHLGAPRRLPARRREAARASTSTSCKGWDYPALCETYQRRPQIVRREHVPAIIHVVELTQPQGHSTSGSHERYKSKERLDWEDEFDCSRKMREWMIDQGIATAAELDAVEEEDLALVREAQRRAWEAFRAPIDAEKRTVLGLLDELAARPRDRRGDPSDRGSELHEQPPLPPRRHGRRCTSALIATAREDARRGAPDRRLEARAGAAQRATATARTCTAATEAGAQVAPRSPAVYAPDAPMLNGFEILNACFDAALAAHPESDRHRRGRRQARRRQPGLRRPAGEVRRAARLRHRHPRSTIVGQAIGMALRGLRPIAEIQYLDYILYALQILSDDLATPALPHRGRQKAPVIIRTRGHRLEGIWHSGSPMSAIINLVRGMRRLRAAQHDAGGRLLQHAAPGGRPGARHRGAERLPHQGEAARQHRRLHACRSASPRSCARART